MRGMDQDGISLRRKKESLLTSLTRQKKKNGTGENKTGAGVINL